VARLDALRTRVAAIEGRAAALAVPGPAWGFGLAAIDPVLGPTGLCPAAVHGLGVDRLAHLPATLELALRLLARLPDPALREDTRQSEHPWGIRRHAAMPPARPLLLVQTSGLTREIGRPYGPGLARRAAPAGPAMPAAQHPDPAPRTRWFRPLTPDRLILVEARSDAEALAALEEGLACAGLAGVLGLGIAVDFTASRRLGLAAQSGGRPCLLLGLRPGAQATASQWQVTPLPSASDPHDPRAPGGWRWRLNLLRARGCPPQGWDIGWEDKDHEPADRFTLAAPSVDRAPSPDARPAAGAGGHTSGGSGPSVRAA